MPARFQFRLQGLLERRKADARKAARILCQSQKASGEAARVLDRAREEVEGARRLEDDWKQYLREMESRSRQTPGDWFDSLAPSRRMLARAARARHNRETEMADAETAVEFHCRAVEEAEIEFQKCMNLQLHTESLRDVQEAEFFRQQELEETAELAEVAAATHDLNHAREDERHAQMRTDGQA